MGTSTLGERIRAHRLAAGFSLRGLAEQLTVTAQALSQYETGKIQPRPNVLAVIAEVLGTNTTQLTQFPVTIKLGQARLLDLRRGTQQFLKQAEGTIVTMTERCLFLEQLLGNNMPPPSLPHLNAAKPHKEAEDVEEFAKEVRKLWNLGTGPLPKLVSLLESKGIRIFETSFVTEKHGGADFIVCSAFLSLSHTTFPDFPVVLVNGDMSDADKRYAFCRELGHILMPALWRHILDEGERERFGKSLAGSLLLPSAALREVLGRRRKTLSWYELDELCDQFGVDYMLIAERSYQAAIITRDTYRKLVHEVRKLESQAKSLSENPFPSPKSESSNRLRRLTLRALTEGVLDTREASSLLSVSEEDLAKWLRPPLRLALVESSQVNATPI